MSGNAYIPLKHTTLPAVVMPGTLRAPMIPPLNDYDLCLARDACLWGEMVSHGGLIKYCCPQGRPKYEKRPWVHMPSQGRRFKPIAKLPLVDIVPIPFDGTDNLVLEEQVPFGYDGVISDIVCEMVAPGGTGFVSGSGDITWRLSANHRYLRDQGDLQVTIGSLINPSPVPRGNLRVYSGNWLRFYVSIAPGAGAVLNPLGIIICSITGWYWPR